MSYQLIELLGYSIGIAAIVGLIRIRLIDRVYFPFIILLWAGLLNEIVNSVVINRGYSNALNSNIYVLVEALLILLFFYRLGLFREKPYVFFGLLLLFTGVWIAENFIFFDIHYFTSYFRILYSFIIVLLSIHQINQLSQQERRRIIRHPSFLIMIGFIAFFTYKTLVEIFWVYGLNASMDFQAGVYRIMTYINLAVNIIFLIAVLWMPRKREFMLP